MRKWTSGPKWTFCPLSRRVRNRLEPGLGVPLRPLVHSPTRDGAQGPAAGTGPSCRDRGRCRIGGYCERSLVAAPLTEGGGPFASRLDTAADGPRRGPRDG